MLHSSPPVRALGAAGLLVVLLLPLIPGCATAPPSFQAVWRDDVVSATPGRRVVVVSEVDVHFGEVREPARYALLGAAVTDRLADHGFEPLDPSRFAMRWRTAVRGAGGLFDPHTGGFLPAKRDSVLSAVLARLQREQAFDYVVLLSLVEVPAPIQEQVAAWDGVRRRYHVTNQPVTSEVRLHGTVPAASILLEAVHRDGTTVLLNRAGLAIAEQGAYDPGSKVLHRHPVPDLTAVVEPGPELLQSVAIALAPLVPRDP